MFRLLRWLRACLQAPRPAAEAGGPAVAVERREWLPAIRALPPGTLAVAIGDVHGRADLLAALHDEIADLAASLMPRDAHLVHLGDLVDRGPGSIAALRLARAGIRGMRSVSLVGNHEERMLGVLDTPDPVEMEAWLGYGGLPVLREAGIDPDGDWRAPLSAALGPDLVAWMRANPRSHRVGDILFVHAGIDPARPLARQEPRDLVWIRKPFVDSPGPYDENVAIVHGHTPVKMLDLAHPHRIDIDTAAYASGRLTALVVFEDRMRIVQAVGPSTR